MRATASPRASRRNRDIRVRPFVAGREVDAEGEGAPHHPHVPPIPPPSAFEPERRVNVRNVTAETCAAGEGAFAVWARVESAHHDDAVPRLNVLFVRGRTPGR